MWVRDVGTTSSIGTTVAVRPETGDIAVVCASFAALLGRDGSVQWRRDDIPGLTLTNVAFAGESIVGGGVLVESQTSSGLAIVAFGQDGTEQWRRIFPAYWNDPNDQLTSLAVTQKKGSLSIYAAGILNNGATAMDMFAVGLDADGSDLPAALSFLSTRLCADAGRGCGMYQSSRDMPRDFTDGRDRMGHRFGFSAMGVRTRARLMPGSAGAAVSSSR